MERLLEAVLGTILRDYVQSSKETEGGAFKASWSSRGISLHDIDLNVSKIKLPQVSFRKATAKSLEVKIPWASLATQAIEVHLVNVDVTLDRDVAVSESGIEAPLARPWDSWPDPSDYRTSKTASNGGWVGDSIQSALLRTAFQVSIFIDGISIAVFHGPKNSIICEVGSFCLTNLSIEELGNLIKKPRLWFNKGLLLQGINVTWRRSEEIIGTLIAESLQISALLPSKLFISTENHDEQSLIPVGVEISNVDINLFDGLFETFQEKKIHEVASNQNDESCIESNQSYFQSMFSFMKIEGKTWALDWGLSILSIRASVHFDDLHKDEFKSPEKNLMTMLCQNIIQRCSTVGEKIEISLGLGSASIEVWDRKIGKVYDVFSTNPLHEFESEHEHALTAAIQSHQTGESIFELNITRMRMNFPWECEALASHIIHTVRISRLSASLSGSEKAKGSKTLGMFSSVTFNISDINIGISNGGDRFFLVLQNLRGSSDISFKNASMLARIGSLNLSNFSDRDTSTQKLSNEVDIFFESDHGRCICSWNPLAIRIESGSALKRVTSCLTGAQNCLEPLIFPISVELEIGSDSFKSFLCVEAGGIRMGSSLSLVLKTEDQAFSLKTNFDVNKSNDTLSVFSRAFEISFQEIIRNRQRSVMRIFMSDLDLTLCKMSKSFLSKCITIEALPIAFDFSWIFIILEFLYMHSKQDLLEQDSMDTSCQSEHVRVDTVSVAMISNSEHDAMCFWLNCVNFEKRRDIEHFSIQDGGIQLEIDHNFVECLSLSRLDARSPIIQATARCGVKGEIDRDAEVVDFEIKIFPCMLSLIDEILVWKNCLQNTWKNTTLSINPARLENSHPVIRSSLVIRIGSVNISILQHQSVTGVGHLCFRLGDISIQYDQASLTNERVWLNRILRNESDSKILVSVKASSAWISGYSGPRAPIVLPFSFMSSIYLWPIGNRKFIHASASQMMIYANMQSVRDISSLLGSFSRRKNTECGEFKTENSLLTTCHTDDDLRHRPSLYLETFDGSVFDTELSAEIIVYAINSKSVSWSYREPRAVKRLIFKDSSGLSSLRKSCFTLSSIDPFSKDRVIVEIFMVDSYDLTLCTKAMQSSSKWHLSWDIWLEEDSIGVLLQSMSIFSVDVELESVPLDSSISVCFEAPRITTAFCAMNWPFGEHMGNHSRVMNVLSELSWLQSHISTGLFKDRKKICCSGRFSLEYTDPFDFVPLRVLDSAGLTARYQFTECEVNPSQYTSQSLGYRPSVTVQDHLFHLDSRTGINLIICKYLPYDFLHLWKLAFEKSHYPLAIKNNSSSQIFTKQFGSSQEIKLEAGEEVRYPLRHDRPRLLQFSSQPQSKVAWSRGVQIFQEPYACVKMPPAGILGVNVVQTHARMLVTLTDGIRLRNSTNKLIYVKIDGQESRLDPGQRCSAFSSDCEVTIRLSKGWSKSFRFDTESQVVEADSPAGTTLDVDTFPSPPVLINAGASSDTPDHYIYHICYPVRLKSFLSQKLFVSGKADSCDSNGDIRILPQESSMDFSLPESGGKVCALSEGRGMKSIEIFCPGYRTQERKDNINQVSDLTSSKIFVPAPGQWAHLSIPSEQGEAVLQPPINLIMQSCITSYSTLELNIFNELSLHNATTTMVRYLIDSAEFPVGPSESVGLNNTESNFLDVEIGPIGDPSDVYRSSKVDISMSAQMILDATNHGMDRFVKVLIDIERDSVGPSKVCLKPYFYLSNMTPYLLSSHNEQFSENETKPLLSPQDASGEGMKIQQYKRGVNGKTLLIDSLRLTEDTDKPYGLTGNLSYRAVRRRDMVHYIVLPNSNTLVLINNLDDEIWATVLSGNMDMLRSYHIDQGATCTLDLGQSEVSLEIRQGGVTHTFDAVLKIAVGELVSRHHISVHRISVDTFAICPMGEQGESRISQYALECSQLCLRYHSSPRNMEEDRVLEFQAHAVSGRLHKDERTRICSINCKVEKFSASLEAGRSKKCIMTTVSSPGATVSCEGFVIEKRTPKKIDAMEISLGALRLMIDDVILLSLFELVGDFRTRREEDSAAEDDVFVELTEIRNPLTLIQRFSLKPIDVLLDIHLSKSPWLPVAVNTSRAPVSIGSALYEGERSMYEIGRLFREHISDGLIRSAPYLLGSLQILFDPVGMFRSLGRGISGIISLPVEGIRQKSLSTFISGLGHGSANLLKEISGWSYGTALGFSRSILNVLKKNSAYVEKRRANEEDADKEEVDVRVSRPLVYGIQNLVNLTIRLGAVLWYRDILEARVSLMEDPRLTIKIAFPVLLIHEEGLVVFAHWGRTPSFYMSSIRDAQMYLVAETHEIVMECEHCRTFGNQEKNQSRYSRVNFRFAADDFPGVLQLVQETFQGFVLRKHE